MNRTALQELESRLAEIQDRVTELAPMDDRNLRERCVELCLSDLAELRKGVRHFLERAQ